MWDRLKFFFTPFHDGRYEDMRGNWKGVTGVPRFNTRALAECSLESSSDLGACG